MDQPILRNHELETLRHVSHDIFSAHTIDITWPLADGPGGHGASAGRRLRRGDDAIAEGVNIDRSCPTARSSAERAPIPSLLAVAAVHHHLVREGTRLRAGLVLESGEPREVHHFATLIGYGASAINPYLLFETVDELVAEGRVARASTDPTRPRAQRRQGDRQGPAQDDLQDGDLDDPVLLRRADLRGGRARARARRPPLHRHGVADRRHRRRACSRARRSTATPAPIPARAVGRRCCRSAASTPGAATASSTCGTRRRSRCCSTRSAATATAR